MRTFRLNQHGGTHIVALLAVVVVIAVAFAGYRVMQASDTADNAVTTAAKDNDATASKDTATASSEAPAKLETKSDVQNATKTLEADGLESDLDPAQLDADLNGLL